MQRLGWKHDLIARVDSRIHALPVAAPARADWSMMTAMADDYHHVSATGTLLPQDTVLVQAVTTYGGGFWVLTPLRLDPFGIVFVNRGFVPADRKDAAGWRPLPAQTTTVTGLLRMSEPDGAFLRINDPAANRWFSRDTLAMARAKGLGDAAPFFIDAEATGERGLPIAGLTVVAFPDNHLVYALTWYGLALLTGVLGYRAWRSNEASTASGRDDCTTDEARDQKDAP